MTTTTFAAIESSSPTGTVYGIGSTPEAAIADALRGCPDLADLAAVPCTPAAAAHVETYGGAPSPRLVVTLRDGVALREEE